MSQTKAQLIDPVDGTIVNADINASAAIAGTKISPDFGSQAISTTGDITTSGDIITGDRIRHNGDTNTVIRFPANDTIALETAGTESYRVDSSGRILVKTTAQRIISGGSARLHIENNSTELLSICRNSSDNGSPLFAIGKTRGGSIVQDDDVLGTISFAGDDGVDLNHSGAEIRAAVDGTPGANDMPGRLEFRTTADGSSNSTERMRIDSSGNVGIGTSSPLKKLHIADAGDVALMLQTTNAVDDKEIFEIGCSGNASNHADLIFRTRVNAGTGGSEVLRLTNVGNVGIGTSTIADDADHCKLAISGQSGTAAGILIFQDTSNNEDGMIFADNGSLVLSADRANATASSFMAFRVDGSSEKMRITNEAVGQVFVGCTAEPTGGNSGIMLQGNGFAVVAYSGSGSANVFEFNNSNNTVGRINCNGSNTSYLTSSDYRLKENESAISDGITRLKTLKPYRFNFKTEPSVTQDGFFAHEVFSVVPQAVVGNKDATKKDGSIDPQGLDHSKLVPLLVAAVQELIGRVETLEAA